MNDDLIAGMTALVPSGGEPQVIGIRGEVVVLRVGDMVVKAHPRDEDVATLTARMRVAQGLPGLMLPPLSAVPSMVLGRAVTLWPYGTPVSQADPDAAPWEESATLLARLHSTPVSGPLPPARTPARIHRAVADLPDSPAAREVLRAYATLPSLDLPGSALTHGDWHLGQLVHRGSWLLIDVDDLGVGDPVWDLARPAALYAAGILGPELWSRFLDAYLAAGGPALPGDPWSSLDVPARAFVVQMASRALLTGTEARDTLVEACTRIVSTHDHMAHD